VEVLRAAAALQACDTPMQKYRQLVSLQNTDEVRFISFVSLFIECVRVPYPRLNTCGAL